VGKSAISISLLLSVVFAVGGPAIGADNAVAKTLKNLIAAYNAGVDAHQRYLAYATKADSEGYGKAASLFRAAARGEEIGMNRNADLIRKMGGEPINNVATPDVASTHDNLMAASQNGAGHLNDVPWQTFIREAKAEHDVDAAKSFSTSEAAEAEQYKLFTGALATLPRMKGDKRDYYVCSSNGFAAAKPIPRKCSGSKYETIN